MAAYYNEICPFAIEWMKNLMSAGLIAPGDIDERSIEEVTADDVKSYTQCHYFAGIGVWSYALRLAGFPDDRRVWTGSAPCQPFSKAGKAEGFDDKRHLWPHFHRLIAECRPELILGEQVASVLITGRSATSDMQGLWDRKTQLRILKDRVETDLPFDMQNLPESDVPRFKQLAQGVNSLSCVQNGGWGEIPRGSQRPSVRADRRVGSNSIGEGDLSVNRHSFRPISGEGLEQPFSGSNKSRTRLHDSEYPGDPFWSERSMWKLGREPSYRNGPSDYEMAQRAITEASKLLDRRIEEGDGRSWIDTLQFDLEALGYAFGSVPFASASIGAPHIRDRVYWVGHANHTGLPNSQPGSLGGAWGREEGGTTQQPSGTFDRLADTSVRGEWPQYRQSGSGLRQQIEVGRLGVPGGLADTPNIGRIEGGFSIPEKERDGITGDGSFSRLANANSAESKQFAGQRPGSNEAQGAGSYGQLDGRRELSTGLSTAGPVNGFWSDADWLFCRDNRWRPVEPGASALAYGIAEGVGRMQPRLEAMGFSAEDIKRILRKRESAVAVAGRNRVGRLKAYGNAINAQQAKEFIQIAMRYQP